MQKCIYIYEHIDEWKKLNETFLPRRGDFYSHLNMEDSTDLDYRHTKRFRKDFKIKKKKIMIC